MQTRVPPSSALVTVANGEQKDLSLFIPRSKGK